MFDLLGQHDGRLKQFFKDPRIRAMFTFQVMTCILCLSTPHGTQCRHRSQRVLPPDPSSPTQPLTLPCRIYTWVSHPIQLQVG